MRSKLRIKLGNRVLLVLYNFMTEYTGISFFHIRRKSLQRKSKFNCLSVHSIDLLSPTEDSVGKKLENGAIETFAGIFVPEQRMNILAILLSFEIVHIRIRAGMRVSTKYVRIYTGSFRFVTQPNFAYTSRHYRLVDRIGGWGLRVAANLCRRKCFIRTNSSMAHGILLDTNDPWIPRIWMGHGSPGFRQASRIIRSSILLLAYR